MSFREQRGPLRRRRSPRLAGYDYSQNGAYFVTITSFQRACIFGEIFGEEMRLNDCGSIVCNSWHDIPEHHPQVVLDEFVVMPNHVHGVLLLLGDGPPGDAGVAPTVRDGLQGNVGVAPTARRQPSGPSSGSLGAVIGSFKSAVTRGINRVRGSPGVSVWQRNYHDRIIRDEDELLRIRTYIRENPLRWALDPENPDRSS